MDSPKIRSLEDLYERHSGAVLAYLLHLSGDHHLAEDLTGETFYKAILALDGFRGDGSVRGWLIRIARNLYLRKAERERRSTSLDELQDTGAVFPAGGDDPEEEILRRERSRHIQQAILSLPENDRTVLLLSAQEKMRCREIADVLGVSTNAVKVRLFRARRRLVDALRTTGMEEIDNVEL